MQPARIAEPRPKFPRLLRPSPGQVAPPVADSPAMQNVLQAAQRFAQSPATILITGESGTGKEVVARYIHECSSRCEKPYIRVNCAALPESLIESELFGHERGAFTGANESRRGRLECAGTGTLLLDEISEIPLSLQAKLLRVLEEEEYQRVGGNQTLHVTARIIATSNRNLEETIQQGGFRADLFYRLNVLRLQMPALRRRREDIAELANVFLNLFGPSAPVPVREIASTALTLLQKHNWPGNVRQLKNTIQRACVLSESHAIEVDGLTDILCSHGEIGGVDLTSTRLDELEHQAIVATLRHFHGNKTAAATQLGVTSRTLSNKIKRYRELGWADG